MAPRDFIRFRALALLQVVLGLVLGVLVPGRAGAAFDVFIRFSHPNPSADPYIGESSDPQFPGSNGWSVVRSVQHGFERPGTGNPGTLGPVATTFAFSKSVDRGSPALFNALASGASYEAAQLVFRPQAPVAPGTPPLSVTKLESVGVTSVRAVMDETSNQVVEQVTVRFSRIQWSYRAVDPVGQVGTMTTVHWDLLQSTGGFGPLPGLDLSPAALPDGAVGLAYTASFVASGGTFPYRFQLQGGALPAGLALSGTGQLTGASSTTGLFTFTIAAVDDNYCFAERRYTLAIHDRCSLAPRITSITRTGVTVRLRLECTSGCRYQLQGTAAISGPWINVGAAIIAPSSGLLEFTDAPVLPRRFYRVIGG